MQLGRAHELVQALARQAELPAGPAGERGHGPHVARELGPRVLEVAHERVPAGHRGAAVAPEQVDGGHAHDGKAGAPLAQRGQRGGHGRAGDPAADGEAVVVEPVGAPVRRDRGSAAPVQAHEHGLADLRAKRLAVLREAIEREQLKHPHRSGETTPHRIEGKQPKESR